MPIRLYAILKTLFIVALVISLKQGKHLTAAETMSVESFIPTYREAVKSLKRRIVDVEITTEEQIPRRGKYNRTIFVQTPGTEDISLSRRGDVLNSLDSEPHQGIISRAHFCDGKSVTVLIKRQSSGNPYEIYLLEGANIDTLRHNIVENVDVTAFASLGWIGHEWLPYFEDPAAELSIEIEDSQEHRLAHVTFDITKVKNATLMSAAFSEGIATFDIENDWAFTKFRTLEKGFHVAHRPDDKMYFDIDLDYGNDRSGIPVPKRIYLRSFFLNNAGKESDVSENIINVLNVDPKKIPDEYFTLSHYGLADLAQEPKGISIKFAVILVNLLIIIGVAWYLSQRRSVS